MVDPGTAHTQKEFTQKLRQLISETGRSSEAIAKRGGLSGNTVRTATEGDTWPQQRTVEQLVSACDQDPRPWVDAWRPLNDARPLPGRFSGKDLQEQVDALKSAVGTLRVQVRSLRDSLEEGEFGDQRRARRKANAYCVFLTQMPISEELRRAECEPNSSASPMLTYREPAYKATAVESLLDDVKRLATAEHLPELALKLATSPLPDVVTFTDARDPYLGAPSDYTKSDVDNYLAKLRACVHQYLRDCTDDRFHTPLAEQGQSGSGGGRT
ncbi:hypothetical protein [Streptomyces tubercidicus]|uniref:hypothetical protein n=1 Tax=Streptomyces tubercidicus TaxID=47759 RepID=UPI0036CE29DF